MVGYATLTHPTIIYNHHKQPHYPHPQKMAFYQQGLRAVILIQQPL